MYEVLPTEPLHDVKEHISNIITEITAHLTDDEKKLCQDTLSLVSGTKDQLRGSDYREICIVLAKQLRGEKHIHISKKQKKKYRYFLMISINSPSPQTPRFVKLRGTGC